jgi:hypothetical protein
MSTLLMAIGIGFTGITGAIEDVVAGVVSDAAVDAAFFRSLSAYFKTNCFTHLKIYKRQIETERERDRERRLCQKAYIM